MAIMNSYIHTCGKLNPQGVILEKNCEYHCEL